MGRGVAAIARKCYKDGTLEKLVDPKIKIKEDDENNFMLNGVVNQVSLEKFSDIAYKCVAETQNNRPTIEDVIKKLKEALHYQENHKDNFKISFEEISLGTEKFSDDKCIGEGRYWKQYVGEITHIDKRTAVVAKRWDNDFPQSHHQFFTELRILHEYKHENIVSLVGYCNEMGEQIIVYEYASNGSLDKQLNNASLTWTRRLKICIDVARGLEFLHESVLMVHRDIKSASILIDGDWNAKISNLELCEQLWKTEAIEHVSDDNAYVSPDGISMGFLIKHSDIYSLGVILKEIWWGRLMVPTHHSQDLSLCCRKVNKVTGYIYVNGIMKHVACIKSTYPFERIANSCLHLLPEAREVITELEKALKVQEDYEEWLPRLPVDYKEIINWSKDPVKYNSVEMYKDLYDMFSEGILLKDGKVLFSLGSNGEINEMISARKFSYRKCGSYKLRSLQESRFKKVAEVSFVLNMNIKTNIRTFFLSSGVNYGVHLVFKFCGSRKSSTKPVYVNLTYKMGNGTFHAYFATWRDANWMMIELYRFLNNNEDNDFKFLLESFSQSYCGNHAVYIEGVEFRAIDNVLKSNLSNDQVHPLPTWISREVKEFEMTQVISIKCKIESQILSRDKDYACYLVFKLSEQCKGLHCPVRVRDVLHWTNKDIRVLYFRPPNPSNLLHGSEVSKKREDGLMEVIMWKFNSTSNRRHDYIPMNLKLITYEGTMSGLIQCGYYIKRM